MVSYWDQTLRVQWRTIYFKMRSIFHRGRPHSCRGCHVSLVVIERWDVSLLHCVAARTFQTSVNSVDKISSCISLFLCYSVKLIIEGSFLCVKISISIFLVSSTDLKCSLNDHTARLRAMISARKVNKTMLQIDLKQLLIASILGVDERPQVVVSAKLV